MGMQKKTSSILVVAAVLTVLAVSIYLGLWFFFVSNPWGVTKVGKLRDQKTYTVGNYRVQLNLHEARGMVGGPPNLHDSAIPSKVLWLWCQTDKTVRLNLSHQLNEYQEAAAFTETGWQRFLTKGTHITNIPPELIGILFHAVNSEIAFVEGWYGIVITFDSCATKTTVMHGQYIFGPWSQTLPQGDLNRPSFFKKFTPTADNTGGCFDVEPLYLQDQSKLRQLCTTDKGKTWSVPPDAAAPAERPPDGTKS